MTTASPDGSVWEITSPLTCEWVAPAQPKRRPGRPQTQPTLAEDLGLVPPANWGKAQAPSAHKPRSRKKIA